MATETDVPSRRNLFRESIVASTMAAWMLFSIFMLITEGLGGFIVALLAPFPIAFLWTSVGLIPLWATSYGTAVFLTLWLTEIAVSWGVGWGMTSLGRFHFPASVYAVRTYLLVTILNGVLFFLTYGRMS